MSTADLILWVKPYFEAAALLFVAALAVRLLLRARVTVATPVVHLLVVLALGLPWVMSLVPREALIRPRAQIWSGSGRTGQLRASFVTVHPEKVLKPAVEVRVYKDRMGIVLSILAAGFSIALVVLILRISSLRAFLRSLIVVKRIGKVSLCTGDAVSAPFSAWMGRGFVALPLSLLSQRRELLISLRHEIEHHRARDTVWIYFYEILKALFFWNPAIFWLSNDVRELQEIACDRTLIGRRRIPPRAYGRCLIEAALMETALKPRFMRVGTTGMAAGLKGNHLKRRIEMLTQSKERQSKAGRLGIVMGTILIMATLAYASKGAIQDKRLTLEEAKKYAQIASQGSEIPIHLNDLVLERLNRFVGTADGRKHVKGAFLRLPQYRTMIEQKADQHGVPREVVAMAMFESGLRNDVISTHKAAGIWQFIPATARKYNLVVNEKRDDRFNPQLETVAAMRYLSDLFELFHDWHLAMKAYNEGESRVAKLIKKYDTKDPWALERADTTESYLSGAIAMMIILKNPELVE